MDNNIPIPNANEKMNVGKIHFGSDTISPSPSEVDSGSEYTSNKNALNELEDAIKKGVFENGSE